MQGFESALSIGDRKWFPLLRGVNEHNKHQELQCSRLYFTFASSPGLQQNTTEQIQPKVLGFTKEVEQQPQELNTQERHKH